jgi:formylglycine-generating enzyme required for sulfatase activity
MWRLFLIVFLVGAQPWQVAEAATPGAGEVKAVKAVEARRIALVIGNGSYADDPLSSPANDARAMSSSLRALGFEVMNYEDATRQTMLDAIREFTARLNAGGVGLFYFAGHGFGVGDRTVLLPVDADGRAPARLLADGVDLQTVVAGMSGPRPGKLNLLIVDSCLNNPFRSGAIVPAVSAPPPEQTLIAYATAAGHFAADGTRHGLYTAALLKAMREPGRDVREMFPSVHAQVSRASRNEQNPTLSSSLSSLSPAFSFVEAGQDPGPLPAELLAAADDSGGGATRTRGILPQSSAEQYELVFWDSVKDSSHASDYEAYLQAYPKGRFAALAKARLERLRNTATAPKTETPAERPAPASKAAPERPAAARAAPERSQPAAAKAVPEPPQDAAPAGPAPRRTATDNVSIGEIKDCPGCPALVTLPRGAFTMGSNADDLSERPAHQVSIGAPFAIGKYEVTAEQWNACAAADACPRLANIASMPGNVPAHDVSWEDAQKYVAWLSKTTGKTYRLPTEAEWEYAARGGTATRHWWGEQMRAGNANCKGCGEPWQQDAPAKVGSFAANPYGLHDVNGSVWEWVSDCWHNSYRGAPADGRAWDEQNCRVRVIRGGSWRDGPAYMLSSTRFKYDASVRESQNGFRVARDIN